MHLLVLQHTANDHLGVLRTFLDEDGHRHNALILDKDQPLPEPGRFDGLWVIGALDGGWDGYLWRDRACAFIREAVQERGVPFLGIGLGHLLLADALGGTVGAAASNEIGIMEVQLTEEGASGVFLDGMPERFDCLQWHDHEVQQMPAGATCLATSKGSVVQVMKWGTRAYSTQFHLAAGQDWATRNAATVSDRLGEDAANDLSGRLADRHDDFSAWAERLYINWMQTSAQA